MMLLCVRRGTNWVLASGRFGGLGDDCGASRSAPAVSVSCSAGPGSKTFPSPDAQRSVHRRYGLRRCNGGEDGESLALAGLHGLVLFSVHDGEV